MALRSRPTFGGGSRLRPLLPLALALAFAPAAVPAASQELLVFAAASLKNALDEIDDAYRRANGVGAVVAYAATSALARQIEAGAPADLFIAADRDWMDYVAARRLIRPASRIDLVGNRLVLIAPRGRTGEFELVAEFPLARLLGDGRLAIANTSHVPAGRYGKAALEALGIWPSVRGRLAESADVRAALAWVARGEAPLGIVYRSDALADAAVAIVASVPPASHPPIVYPAAVLAGSTHAEAERYLAFVAGPDAAALFGAHGFIPRE